MAALHYLASYLAIFTLLVCTKAATSANGTSLRCHECSGVTDPHYCSMVVHCAADEECHTEKVIGDESAVFYNSGCQKIQLCQMAAKGRRSDIHVCEGCCGTDLCNSELCPAGNSSSPGVQCYQCDEVDSPTDCNNRITCANGEQCIVQKYANDKMEVKYSLGCETRSRCDLLKQLGKRSTQICNECCDTPGCNRHLCFNGTDTNNCTDQPDIDCHMFNSTQNICALHSLAATKYCPKFCGYCTTDGSIPTTIAPPTGSTKDPCQDSGELDCRQMNETLHICDKPDSPPTLLYCPRFCKLCTPSTHACSDSPDVDCKKADDDQNICATHALAATNYCQKYCGYCSADGSPLPSHATYTGTTQDPCRDSGEIDCKQMDDALHICSKKDSPPTKLYCPKYCGLCTPSAGSAGATTASAVTMPTTPACQDTGDIDCKAMDDALHICAKASPPTKMYCSKYCGLC